MTSIQCIATASSSGASVSKQLKTTQCVAAAQAASNEVESCKNTGTTTPESAGRAGGSALDAESRQRGCEGRDLNPYRSYPTGT